MENFPEIPFRKSLRLKNFNYASTASYFVTSVAQNRQCLFGDIHAGEMHLSFIGKIIETAWLTLEERFPSVLLGEYVIMPNHLHAVLSIYHPLDTLTTASSTKHTIDHVVAPLVGASFFPEPTNSVSPQDPADRITTVDEPGNQKQAPTRGATTKNRPCLLGDVIGAFKSISTHECILAVRRGEIPPFAGRIWQPNYYEHIVRNDFEWEQICHYIAANPTGWDNDEENPASNRSKR